MLCPTVQMSDYKFIIKKIQKSYIEKQFDEEKPIREIIEEIEEMSEEELNFSEPKYDIECIVQVQSKIEKIIYKSSYLFLISCLTL